MSYVIERQMKQVVNVCAHSASLDALFFRHTPSVCAATNTHTHTPCLRISMRRFSYVQLNLYRLNGRSKMESFMLENILRKVSHTHRPHSTKCYCEKSIRMNEMLMLMLLSLLFFFVSTTKRFTFQVNKHFKHFLVSSHLIENHDRSHPLWRRDRHTRTSLQLNTFTNIFIIIRVALCSVLSTNAKHIQWPIANHSIAFFFVWWFHRRQRCQSHGFIWK